MKERLLRKRFTTGWLTLLAVLLLAGCYAREGLQANGSMTTNVLRVIDGDTFEITGGERVRMIGVDTPESVKPNTPVQPYAKEASQYTKSLLEGKEVRLQFDVELRDRYDRLLAYVYLPDGTFVNEKLVREGYAQPLTIPPNVAFARKFTAAVEKARAEKRGLWADEPARFDEKTGDRQGQKTSAKQDALEKNPPANKQNPRIKTEPPVDGKLIKGNINRNGEKIYHTPDSPSYAQTKAEAWFATEEEARAAGFRPPKR